jgi:hypothetical protein
MNKQATGTIELAETQLSDAAELNHPICAGTITPLHKMLFSVSNSHIVATANGDPRWFRLKWPCQHDRLSVGWTSKLHQRENASIICCEPVEDDGLPTSVIPQYGIMNRRLLHNYST